MAAGVRYRKARLALAAVVSGGVIGGTAYFAGTAPARTTDAGNTESLVENVAAPAAASAAPGQRAAIPAPAKRSRGS